MFKVKTGRERIMEYQNCIIHDAFGKPVAVIGSLTDISDRIHAENINRTLFAISNAVNTTYNLKELYGSIHTSLGKVIDTTNFIIALYDRKSDMLVAPYFVDEVALDAVLEGRLPAFSELSLYREISWDLSFIVDKLVPVSGVLQDVRAGAGSYLTELRLFDVYTGKGIDPKRKSLALGLTFRDQSRTLGDEDVNLAVNQVIDSLEKNYKAELRN